MSERDEFKKISTLWGEISKLRNQEIVNMIEDTPLEKEKISRRKKSRFFTGATSTGAISTGSKNSQDQFKLNT